MGAGRLDLLRMSHSDNHIYPVSCFNNGIKLMGISNNTAYIEMLVVSFFLYCTKNHLVALFNTQIMALFNRESPFI